MIVMFLSFECSLAYASAFAFASATVTSFAIVSPQAVTFAFSFKNLSGVASGWKDKPLYSSDTVPASTFALLSYL